MAVRILHAMSPSLSVSIAEVAAMFDSVFRKRGMPELILDIDSEEDELRDEDDKEEDEEVEKSLDSDSKSKDAEDEGPNAEDEDPTTRDEGIAAGDEGHDMREIALGEGQMPNVFEIDPEDGIAYIDVPVYPPPAPPVQTPPSPKWSSGSLLISPSPSIVPLPISSPMISLTIPSLGGLIRDHTVRLGELSPTLFESYDGDIVELFTRSRAVKDKIFSQRYRLRGLEHKQERTSAALQRELQEMRGRVTALEQERDRRER
nr:hypothetical protein [Tanacetum cinerariifolium]